MSPPILVPTPARPSQPPPVARFWAVPGLLLLVLWLLALFLGPAVLEMTGLALNPHGHSHLHAHGHPFVDARSFWGMPNAADVLSNLPLSLAGAIGLWRWHRLPPGVLAGPTQRALLVFFFGLMLTGLLSAVYHWRPDASGLALDRLGMAVSFAGVLALAAADRVGPRESNRTLGLVLVLAAVSAWLPLTHGHVLPWAVVQFGGIALVLSVAWRARAVGGLGVCWACLIAIYALAKWVEMTDELVFLASGQWLSGHTLKHLIAALAAWPVVAALRQNARIAGRIDRVIAEQAQRSEEPCHVR